MEGPTNQPNITASPSEESAVRIDLERPSLPVDQDENPVSPQPIDFPEADEGSYRQSRLPAILAKASQEQLHEHFLAEYQPVGPTELTLVRMLAGHAAGAERWELGGGAMSRQTARHLPELLQVTGRGRVLTDEASHPLTDDAMLAGTLVNEAVDRCERHTLRRSRTFLQTLDTLTAVQAARRLSGTQGSPLPPLGFPDEAACEHYLYTRLQRGLVPCPQCGATAGWMLEARQRRECRECQLQIGLRSNTIMARSPISLRQWFDAIRRVLWNPTIGAAELGAQLGVPRVDTARTMRNKIRAALASEQGSELLAGLDRHFAASTAP